MREVHQKGNAALVLLSVLFLLSSSFLLYKAPEHSLLDQSPPLQEVDSALFKSLGEQIFTSTEILYPIPLKDDGLSPWSDKAVLGTPRGHLLVLYKDRKGGLCVSFVDRESEIDAMLDAVNEDILPCSHLSSLDFTSFQTQGQMDPVNGKLKYLKVSLQYSFQSREFLRNGVFPLLSTTDPGAVGL